jgi:hypothetical protein
VGTANEAAIFEPREIAPDAGGRGPGDCQQLFNGCGSGPEKEFDDLLGTVVQRICHRTDSTLLSARRRVSGQVFRDFRGIASPFVQ